MVTWFAYATIAVAIIQALICAFQGLRGREPNDYSMGATLLVALLLIVQIVISIIAPIAGNHAVGDPLEFWMYLIVAFALPIGAGFWALVDRTRFANFVLAVVGFAVAVMTFRMHVIWG